MTLTIYTNFHSLFLTMLDLIVQAVSEKMFEYYGHIHGHSPRAGADNPWGQSFFININLLVHLHIPSKFFPFNFSLLIFPIQMHM